MNSAFRSGIIVLFFFVSYTAWSQMRSSVSGKLKDIENKPLGFVNLVIKQLPDSAIVKLAVSRQDGKFDFQGIEAGSYVIEASMVGYRRLKTPAFTVKSGQDEAIGEFVMAPSDINLKEVNVLGTKPFIIMEPDKMVVRVSDNPLMINSNALEVLRKSPGVMVNQDDQIFLQGKSGLLIYIDGRQSPLSEKDLANWLRSMPSSQIESIEIITNPSAKYDAAGNAGIINIRLKKNTKRGLNGTLSSGLSNGLANEYNYTKTNHSINLNYGGGKINLFGNYGYDYNKGWSFMNVYRKQSEQIFDQKTNSFDNNQSHNFKLGTDWSISKRHTISAMADGNISNNNSDAYSGNYLSTVGDPSPFSLLEAGNSGIRNNNTANFNLNHNYKDTSGREITTDANYGFYNMNNETNQPNFYRNYRPDSSVVDRSFGLKTPVNIDIFTLKTDYEQKIKKSVIGAGYKVSNVTTDNEFSLFNRIGGANDKDLEQSSNFTYLERVAAGYASIRHTFSDKWGAQAGLRFEATHSEGNLTTKSAQGDSLVKRDYANWFPSAGINYTPSKKHMFTLNYSRRIDRPVYRFMNPFQYKLDELSYEQGNPFLNPQYTNNFQLSHTFMSMVTSSVGYSHTTQFFARVIDSSGNRSFLTRRNLADVQTLSVNLSSPLPIRSWWNGFLNVTYNHQQYEANLGPGKSLSLPVDFVNIFMSHSFTLPKKVSVQLSGYYNSPNVWGGTFRNQKFWSVDAGITKKFLKDKAILSLSITDIFRSQRWTANSDFGGIDVRVRGGRDSRQIKLGLTFNFGQADIKQIRRKVGNTEERNRLRGE